MDRLVVIDWITSRPDDELDLLAEALATRRLRLDMSEALLRSYGWPETWAASLAAIARAGHTLGELAVGVSVARRGREGRGRSDLVCTRPRGGGVDVLDTSVAVRRLFTQAKHEVVVAGFRIHDREQLEPLRRPAHAPLDVRLFVDIDPAYAADGARQKGPVDLDTWPAIWWGQFLERVWPTWVDAPRCWYAPSTLGPDASGAWRSMHAKSVVVDRRWWLVTSANFTRRGQERNIEVGALIDDPARAGEVVAAFEAWVGAGVFQPVVAGSG